MRLARRAVELGKDDAVALTRGGHALAHLGGDLDGGVALVDRALVLNPNLAAAWFLGGFLRIWRGDPDQRHRALSRAPCASARSTRRCIACRPGWRWRICWRGALKARRPGPRRHTGICRASCWWSPSSRRATRWPAGWTTRSARCNTCAGSIPRCASPISTDWLPIRRPEHLATFAEGLRKSRAAGMTAG